MLNALLRESAILLSLSLAPAFAQNISGVLTGTVKDSAGSVIPNASVMLTNQSTTAAQTITAGKASATITAGSIVAQHPSSPRQTNV